ncbi:YpdA family putative bacillithiol disulfide reductase [Antarcticibacterium flavum]|uniref:YpdA family putative bacillithiol disulfide reductase n=1 Tax=Antarcticibacterium flavum TaxID=2058175 RepID=A0A5B7X0F6_9FLAO|nr:MULTISPECIES: YpdA family putative bacillithiol disulfide reductase [Antarcticibacterium]MCM4160943.1 YpdA family putative bacillithiol disulfide reductase [Antarcticibacterium sp. W02-3]QCY68986.1 YpdA family putative bacillithiol disulfide reductase [Antarcticibacterium flavum]
MQTAKKKEYDIIIIGGGPIGIACGLEAEKNNLSYLILEKGCLVNSLYHYPTNMTFFSTSEKLELDNIPFISNNPKPRKAEALEYYRRIATSNKLNIRLFEKVLSVKTSEGETHQVETEKDTYNARNVIVATGFYDIPNYLDIPGEDLPKVAHYYNDPHFYATQKVVVVGASNSAVDAALEIYRKGGDVTMIVRSPEIGERVKYWVRPDIINRIEEGSIKGLFNARLKEVREKEVIIETAAGEETLENDFVLLLTGYRPNFKFLQKLGIELSNDGRRIPAYNKDTMESNVPGIYLAGVICGGMETHKWFIENSRVHARMIVGDIVSK